MAGGPSGTGEGINSSSKVMAFIMSAFAAFGGILFGYDTGTISGLMAMDNWLQTFGEPYEGSYIIFTNKKSLVVSILSAGTFFGALLAFPAGNFLGRKWGIVLACAIFCVGIGLQLDTHLNTFIGGRVVAGFGVGIVSCLVPMYQAETAPKSIRGLIGGMYQLAITIGALLAAIVLNATKDRQNSSSWRIPVAVQFAWAFILAGGMMCLPESPRYLVLKDRPEEAKKSLGRLMSLPADSAEVNEQLVEIEMALEAERAIGTATYRDCFRNNISKHGLRTWTGIMLQGWQQLTGINFIFYYGTTFFKSAGIENAFTITIVTNVVNTGVTLFGINFIDRIGRRRLLIWGALTMALAELIVACVGITVGKVPSDGQAINLTAQRVLIAFVCIYIAAFAMSWGPVAWVVTGEIFPLQMRAKGMSLSVASNWLWNFGIGYATPYLVDATTYGVNGVKAANLGVKVFFIWSATCFGCIAFTYFFIPETKGLSLEQIDLLYSESTVLKSESYRKEILERDEHFGENIIRDGPASEKTDIKLGDHVHQEVV